MFDATDEPGLQIQRTSDGLLRQVTGAPGAVTPDVRVSIAAVKRKFELLPTAGTQVRCTAHKVLRVCGRPAIGAAVIRLGPGRTSAVLASASGSRIQAAT